MLPWPIQLYCSAKLVMKRVRIMRLVASCRVEPPITDNSRTDQETYKQTMPVQSVATCCIYTMHATWPKERAYFYTVFETTLHTHTLSSPFSGTTCVGRYQKGKTNLDFTKARDNGISWTICKTAPRSRHINTPAPHHSVFTGRMSFLLPNQRTVT